MKKCSSIAVGVVLLIGVAACSSDKKVSLPGSQTTATATAGSDSSSESVSSGPVATATDRTTGTIPDLSGVSVPSGANGSGLSSDCLAYAQAFSSAFAGDQTGVAGLADAFGKLESSVPDDLKGDLKTLQDGFTKLSELYKKYNNDYSKIVTDPEAQSIFGNKAFTDGLQRMETWLSTECGQSS